MIARFLKLPKLCDLFVCAVHGSSRTRETNLQILNDDVATSMGVTAKDKVDVGASDRIDDDVTIW